MNFSYPLILLALLTVPALIFLRYRRKRRPALQFSDGEILRRLPVTWAVRLQFLLPLLYGLGLCFLIIAMARPQRGLDESKVRTDAVDIVLLVDVSTSMRAEDLGGSFNHENRLDAAKHVIGRFVEERTDDRIGMVAFSALPYTVSPLTLDHGWLLRRMDDLKTGMLEDGTAIGDALASAINRLRDSEAKSKVVILLTDGVNNRGALSPENAAQAAEALGIKIYAVGAGSSGMVRIPVVDPFGGKRYAKQRSQIDEGTLKRISEATGGTYFRAQNFKQLQEVYDQIDDMEKTEIQVETYTRFEERFASFLIAGLILLGLEQLLTLSRMGRML